MVVLAKEIKPPLLLLHHNHQRHSCPFNWSPKSGLDIVPPFDCDPEEQVSWFVRSKQQEENRILWKEGGRGAWSSNSTVFKAVGNVRFKLFFKAVGFLSGVWLPSFVLMARERCYSMVWSPLSLNQRQKLSTSLWSRNRI